MQAGTAKARRDLCRVFGIRMIQHSAASGKSNSITWLAHQLIGIQYQGKNAFDSIVVVTDRRILDQQIRDTIKQFAQVSSTVGHVSRSGDLRTFLRKNHHQYNPTRAACARNYSLNPQQSQTPQSP